MSNIRKIASSIVSACKKKGLKQSVVLDVLAKSQGFRSIQCAESTKANSDDIYMSEKLITRGVLARAYPGHDDLALNVLKESCNDFVEVGDTLFSWMWSLTNSGLIETIKALGFVNMQVGFVGELVCGETPVKNHSPVLEKAFPAEVVKFLQVELRESGKNFEDIIYQELGDYVYSVLAELLSLAVDCGEINNNGEPTVFINNSKDSVFVINDDGLVCASFNSYGFEIHGGRQFTFGDKISKANGRWYVGKTTQEDWLDFKSHIDKHLNIQLPEDILILK
jgi:hypothetical protein